MKTSLSAFVLCALGLEFALATPSFHDVHRHMHKKKDAQTWEQISYSATAAPAASSPPSSPPSTPPAGGCGGPTDPDGFCLQGFGGRTSPITGATVDEYSGNHGAPHGSNVQAIPANAASLYKYKTKFVSTASDTIKIIIWDKVGPDGMPNSGQFSPPVVSFDLAPGATQYVAFDENSQVAWCHDTGRKTQWGAYDCSYGEADFGNLSNNQWSGADHSSIQNTQGSNMPMTIICPTGEVSSNLANGYVADTQPGGIGCNIPPGPVELTCNIG